METRWRLSPIGNQREKADTDSDEDGSVMTPIGAGMTRCRETDEREVGKTGPGRVNQAEWVSGTSEVEEVVDIGMRDVVTHNEGPRNGKEYDEEGNVEGHLVAEEGKDEAGSSRGRT